MREQVTCSCADTERSQQEQNHKMVVRLNLTTHAVTSETGKGAELHFLTETYNLYKQLPHSVTWVFLHCAFAKDSMQSTQAP